MNPRAPHPSSSRLIPEPTNMFWRTNSKYFLFICSKRKCKSKHLCRYIAYLIENSEEKCLALRPLARAEHNSEPKALYIKENLTIYPLWRRFRGRKNLHCHYFRDANQHTIWENLNQPYQIIFVNKKISVASYILGKNGLLFAKRLRMKNKFFGYS